MAPGMMPFPGPPPPGHPGMDPRFRMPLMMIPPELRARLPPPGNHLGKVLVPEVHLSPNKA